MASEPAMSKVRLAAERNDTGAAGCASRVGCLVMSAREAVSTARSNVHAFSARSAADLSKVMDGSFWTRRGRVLSFRDAAFAGSCEVITSSACVDKASSLKSCLNGCRK